jgi:hypothetical protein
VVVTDQFLQLIAVQWNSERIDVYPTRWSRRPESKPDRHKHEARSLFQDKRSSLTEHWIRNESRLTQTTSAEERMLYVNPSLCGWWAMLKEFMQLDLAQEMLISEQTKPWQTGHTARTLFKKADFRIVLISMEKGSVLKEHHADGTISVQVLKGR